MCIAAVSFKDGFTEDELKKFFVANKDGGGYAWLDPETKELRAERFIKNINDYVKKGLELKDVGTLVTHCRIATQGVVEEINGHPFWIEKEALLVHNGTLSGYWDTARELSDTNMFTTEIAPILKDRATLQRVKKRLEDIIGSYNKLILLYKDGEVEIVNENAPSSEWSHDRTKWYSNTWWRNTYGNGNYNAYGMDY